MSETLKPVVIPQAVEPLPGSLDDTPMFYSNSPEMVLQSGILLSTFAADGKAFPEAHQNIPLTGNFNVFFHHITNTTKCLEQGTAYVALLIANPSTTEDIVVEVLDGAHYLTIPDAPFVVLKSIQENSNGDIYAGPGDRVSTELLRDAAPGLSVAEHSATSAAHKTSTAAQRETSSAPTSLTKSWKLKPNETQLLLNIALRTHMPLHKSNGCSGLLRLRSTGPVHLATLSCFVDSGLFSQSQEPSLQQWMEILNNKSLVQPRDLAPSKPDAGGALIYGRVAGVVSGSNWRGTLVNDPDKDVFSLEPGKITSYPLVTVRGGTLGTTQVQSAEMISRYPDTAYQSHGNYGVLYELQLPFFNNSNSEINALISFQSPVKVWNDRNSLKFYKNPPTKIVFRGTIKVTWKDQNQMHSRMVHIVQNEGQEQVPFIELALDRNEHMDVNIQFYYPADCTPPHVLTISCPAAGADSRVNVDSLHNTRDIISPLLIRMRRNTMGWLDRLFGNKDKETAGAPAQPQVASAQTSTTTEIAPERVGLNGEYDQSGLAKRVARAFDQADFQDEQTVWIAQTGTTVVLKGRVPDQELLNKMVAVARTVNGAKAVESDQVVVGKQ
ncbi:MAG: DUF3370 family protein [Candidatus Melainabacteria bacterium]|nr:DUF3370 family protein [Candidatus Melainabacteria bacterium]